MKPVVAICAVLVLAGCVERGGPVKMYVYQEGYSRSQVQDAVDACKIAALHEVPSDPRVMSVPGFTYPNGYGGFSQGMPIIGTVDANRDLRDRQITRCLQAKGFSTTPKPFCSIATEKEVYAYEQSLPPSQVRCIPK